MSGAETTDNSGIGKNRPGDAGGGEKTGARKTAAILVIGDEILSGRTGEANVQAIALWLDGRGVELCEARIIGDAEAAIIEAANALRSRYDYVFTTGGIGPTHDDITANAIARAFGVAIGERADALAILRAHYGEAALTPARRRMARIPDGARLIDNPVTAAPGFQLENVFVLAGVPRIMQAMLEGLDDRIAAGPAMARRSVVCDLPESVLAPALSALQARSPDLRIGSYPRMGDDPTTEGPASVTIAISGASSAAVADGIEAVQAAILEKGGRVLD